MSFQKAYQLQHSLKPSKEMSPFMVSVTGKSMCLNVRQADVQEEWGVGGRSLQNKEKFLL